MSTRIEELTVTPESFKDSWERLSGMTQLFSDLEPASPEWWADRLARRDSVFYSIRDDNGDIGVVYFTDVVPGLNAVGHIIFWDKKLKAREDIALNAVRQVMKEFALVRITSIVPEWNKAAQKFAERIGMKLEGVVRRATISKGKYHDLRLYGLLREEVNG